MGIADRVSSVAEQATSFKVKALIYGPPGVGKTKLACEAPKPLLLDADGTGGLTLLNHPELAVNTKRLQVREIEDITQILAALHGGEFADRETIIIDTLTTAQQRHLDEVVAREKLVNPQRAAIPFQSDYKTNTEGMRKLVGWFVDLDLNIIVLAHETEDRNDQTGKVTTRPFLTPKLSSTMEGVFDIFGYMTAQVDSQFNVTRGLQIMPSRTIKAKTRIGGLPPIIENPSFKMILDAKAEMVRKNEEMNNLIHEAEARADQSAQTQGAST